MAKYFLLIGEFDKEIEYYTNEIKSLGNGVIQFVDQNGKKRIRHETQIIKQNMNE